MILTRNPFYYNTPYPNTFITSVAFTIEVGTGSTTTLVSEQTYTVSKPTVAVTSTNTWVDVAPFIRDLFTYTPMSFTGVSAAEIRESGTNSVLLTKVTAAFVDSIGSNETPLQNTYICTDGYGYYTDGQNLQPTQKILLSHTEYKADYRGYFIVPLQCATGDSNPTINSVEVALSFTDNNLNYIKYLVVPMSAYSDTVTIAFEGEEITIEPIEECKYDVNEIQFINKFGVFEILHTYKTKKDSISIQSKKFKNNYTNGVSYDTARHQIKRFNVTSNKKTKIETGFLNEEYNLTIQELLESENMWVNGRPINMDSNSLDFKTRLVDKLISYSLSFEYAYDEINNV